MDTTDITLSKNIGFPHVSNWVNRYSIKLDIPHYDDQSMNEESSLYFAKVIDLIKTGELPVVKCVTQHSDYLLFRCESISNKDSIERMLKRVLFTY